jgi:hypothetical protein
MQWMLRLAVVAAVCSALPARTALLHPCEPQSTRSTPSNAPVLNPEVGSKIPRLALVPGDLVVTPDAMHMAPFACALEDAGWRVLDIDGTVLTGDVLGDLARALASHGAGAGGAELGRIEPGTTINAPRNATAQLLLVNPKP